MRSLTALVLLSSPHKTKAERIYAFRSICYFFSVLLGVCSDDLIPSLKLSCSMNVFIENFFLSGIFPLVY